MTFNVVALCTLLVISPVEATAKVATQDGTSPAIAKVVVLIKEIMAKMEADRQMEQKIYDKYACWCEKTLDRKARAIDEAKETIDKTQKEVIEIKGKLGELGATLQQLDKEIKENQEAMKEAIEIREKENQDYVQERTESEQVIAALEAAIKVLSLSQTGTGTKNVMLQSLQEAQLLSVVGGVKSALRQASSSDEVKESDLDLVKEFTENPSKFLSSGFSGVQTGTESGKPSSQITGILKGMYDGFVADLEKANAEEAEKQKSFEELETTKKEELATLTATRETKTQENGDAEKTLADDNVLLEDTTVQLKADEKFFAETKAGCKAKAKEWAEHSRLTTEELQGVAKAIEILEKGAFVQVHSSFLQVSAKVMDKHRVAAYSKLQALFKKGGAKQLALVLATLKSGGHFDEVIGMIDKMIADLRTEEQDDIDKRDACNNEANKLKAQAEDLSYNIEKKNKLLSRQGAKRDDVRQAKIAKQDEIKAAKNVMAEMLAARNEEHAKFIESLKAGAEEAATLGSAVDALTKFYTDNKIPLELAQQSESEDPKYTIDEDKAPDANFGGGGGRKSETKGIIGILSMLKEDVEKGMKTAKEEDAAAQKEYEKLKAESQEALDALLKTETALKSEEADLDDKITDNEGEIANHEDQETNTAKEKKAHKASCDWLDKFQSRRDKRKAEIEGLQEAKAILSGARPGSFLQLN